MGSASGRSHIPHQSLTWWNKATHIPLTHEHLRGVHAGHPDLNLRLTRGQKWLVRDTFPNLGDNWPLRSSTEWAPSKTDSGLRAFKTMHSCSSLDQGLSNRSPPSRRRRSPFLVSGHSWHKIGRPVAVVMRTQRSVAQPSPLSLYKRYLTDFLSVPSASARLDILEERIRKLKQKP